MTYTALSEKGQVVIPKSFRELLDLQPLDKLQIELEDGKIVLSPLPQINDVFGLFKVKKPVTRQDAKNIVKGHVSKKFKIEK